MSRRFPLLGLVAVLIVMTGCGDSLTDPQESDLLVDRHISESGKFRNSHLMEKAMRPGAAGKFGNQSSLQLVFSINKQRLIERYGVVERFSVLERYKVLERYHVVERYEYGNVFDGYAITIDDSLGLSAYDDFLAELAADDEISWFEPDFSVTTPDPNAEIGSAGQTVPWSVAAIGGQTSWAASGDHTGMVDVDVYVLDTGVARPGAGDNDLNMVESLDMRDGFDDASDYDGHGTHVAGIIAAMDDTDGLVGVAPGARIHNMKVLGDDGTTDVSVVIAAVEELTARKLADPASPMIVNMSLGENVGTPEFTALDHAIEASTDAGVIFVIAAGNQGDNSDFVTPAKVPGAITVGSHNALGLFSPFSNYGPKVDILAPGEGVVSLAPGTLVPTSMSGTSMAAPHVAGAAALYVSQNPTATTEEVLAHLLANAQDFVVGAPPATTTKSVWVGGSQ
ncbi:MAG: S8 family serine peptidase [Rhodothermales bacterium]|nr:S8 family serine peptidase [Rhodothermales bacterium]MBO6780203.1 S8 family serine peptidase [Rhodothermales bacterium]